MSSASHHDPHPGEGVETEGVPATYLLGLTVAVSVLLVAVVLFAVQLARSEFRRAEVAAVTMTGYPALRDVNAGAEEKLLQYGVVDAGAGRYRIPIDRAIDLMVNEAAFEQGRIVSDELRLTR